MMEKLLVEYREKFDEQFPIMLVRGMTDDEIIKIVQQCLDEDKPYEPTLVEGADY